MLTELQTPIRKTLRGEPAVLARGAGGSLVVIVLGAGIGLIAQAILARLMGEVHYGAYIYAFSWMTVLGSFALVGHDRVLLRYLAVYRSRKDWPSYRGLLHRSRAVVLASGTVFAVATTMTVWLLRIRLEPLLIPTLYIGSILLPIVGLATLNQAGLQSLRHAVLALSPLAILRPALTVAGVAVAYVLLGNINAPQAMVLHVIATTVVLAVGWLAFAGKVPEGAKKAQRGFHSSEWNAMALPVLFSAGMGALLKRTDILLIGIWVGLPEAGFYAAASRLVELVGFGLNAVNTIAAPMIAELYAGRDRRNLQRILGVAAVGVLFITSAVSLVLLVLGKNLLGLFGEEFKIAYLAMVVLLAGNAVHALAGPVGQLLNMTGHQRAAALIVGIFTVANLLLNSLLIPLYGILGAAIATSLSTIGWNIAMLVLVRKWIRVDPTIFGLIRVNL